jgi:HEAT repeat protein
VPQGQGGPTTPRPPATRRPTRDVELERVLSEVDRAEAARRRELDMQDRQIQREIEQQVREQANQDRAVQRQIEQQLAQIRREAEQQDRNLQRQIEQQLAQARRDFDMHDRAIQREQDRIAQQLIRDTEMQERIATREMEHAVRSAQAAARADVAINTTRAYSWTPADARVTVPAPWVPQDIADSAWQAARELFNRGEYGQAAQAFRALPTRYPNSAYASEAAYYQAFSLFRIGGTSELREALAALEASKTKYPNARSRTEAANLTTRIQGALARRGDQQAAAALTRTGEAGVTCDREEQSVQAEAMNQLSRMEGSNVNELITRVLARKDECAIPLRRTAVFLVGNRRDAQAIGILAGVARNDPSVDVKVEAIQVIGRLPNEEGVPVLEELAKNDDERVQRAAVRALVRHPSARARTSVRNLVESDNVSERVRSEALSSFDAERATQEDVAWLRALYGKVTTPTLKARTLSAIVRIGGPEVDQWLATIARDESQPSEIRATAMRRIGESMSIPDLGRLYDSATQRRFRAEIITVLGKRKEDAATDKLIDIIKNGTDPQLRTSAISAVANKNDARAQQLLLEIINK